MTETLPFSSTELPRVTVLSPFMSNVPQTILDHQKAVYESLGIPLRQVPIDGMEHAQWLDVIAMDPPEELVVVSDIDAFPIRTEGYEIAIKSAIEGKLFGLAQVANHVDPDEVYAGPMFMAFSRETFDRLGQPSMLRSSRSDAAQMLTIAARRRDIEVRLAMPNAVVQSKWALSDKGVFGIGTFYENNRFFHLFQARSKKNIRLFCAVAEDVAAGSPLNFTRYLEIIHGPSRKRIFGVKMPR